MRKEIALLKRREILVEDDYGWRKKTLFPPTTMNAHLGAIALTLPASITFQSMFARIFQANDFLRLIHLNQGVSVCYWFHNARHWGCFCLPYKAFPYHTSNDNSSWKKNRSPGKRLLKLLSKVCRRKKPLLRKYLQIKDQNLSLSLALGLLPEALKLLLNS